MEAIPEPVVQDGIDYWNTQPANEDGVLGGFGTGSLPRVDALGSRQFLLYLRPDLCTVPSVIKSLKTPETTSSNRPRALDVGAGIGRVTAQVLLHIIPDVVLLEPVENFVQEAWRRGSAHDTTWKGVRDRTKSVDFFQGTLQAFNPACPCASAKSLGRVGYVPPEGTSADADSGFDVVWCQWCLGHLSDTDLVKFFERSRAALRNSKSLIIVKENICWNPDGETRTVFDEQDSSLTRSDLAWKDAFQKAGLKLIYEQVQEGLPEGLYSVKMYALR